MGNIKTVDLFWERFDSGDFKDAKELLSDELEVVWPASREIFSNRADFIEMNIEFPGSWSFKKFKTQIISETEVFSVVNVFSPDAEERFFAASVIKLNKGQIVKIETYWAQEGQQPDWRQKYSRVY